MKWFLVESKKYTTWVEELATELKSEAMLEAMRAWERMGDGDKKKCTEFRIVFADLDEYGEFDYDTIEDEWDLLRGMNRIAVGTTYSDPEGTWEVTWCGTDMVDVECIQEGNPNYGEVYQEPKHQIAYYLEGGK